MEKQINTSLEYSPRVKKVYLKFFGEPSIINKLKAACKSFNVDSSNSDPNVISIALGVKKQEDGGISDYERMFGNENESSTSTFNNICNWLSKNKYHVNSERVDQDLQLINSQLEITQAMIKPMAQNFIDKIFSNIESGLKDQNIRQLLNSIGTFSVDDEGNASFVKLMNVSKFSERNTLWIIAQWMEKGRQGTPTIIATQSQWRSVGRYVNGNALPLLATTPQQMGPRGDAAAESDLGVSREQAKKFGSNAERNFDKYSRFSDIKAESFYGTFYFDISDTTVFDNELNSKFENDANMANVSHEYNEAAKEILGQSDDVNVDVENSGVDVSKLPQNNESNEMLCRNTIEAIAKEENNKQVLDAIKKNLSTEDLLKQFFLSTDSISREHDNSLKKAKLNMCVYGVMVYLNLYSNPTVTAKIYKSFHDKLGKKDNLWGLWSTMAKLIDRIEFQNNNRLKESVMNEGFTFDKFLNLFGISQEEYRNMPKDEAEANIRTEQLNHKKAIFTESFSNLWNRMVDIDKRNLHD